MIGDLQQLAPVVKDEDWQLLKDCYDTPYFFSSRALKQAGYCTIELNTVYRPEVSAIPRMALLSPVASSSSSRVRCIRYLQ